jgi:hypothetical protein
MQGMNISTATFNLGWVFPFNYQKGYMDLSLVPPGKLTVERATFILNDLLMP